MRTANTSGCNCNNSSRPAFSVLDCSCLKISIYADCAKSIDADERTISNCCLKLKILYLLLPLAVIPFPPF